MHPVLSGDSYGDYALWRLSLILREISEDVSPAAHPSGTSDVRSTPSVDSQVAEDALDTPTGDSTAMHRCGAEGVPQ
jgi:hypothetical protein